MKRFIILILTILTTLQISGQYIDLKQYKDAGIDFNQSPPQDLLYLGICNCDLDIIKSAIAKGADVNKQLEGAGISTFPLCSAIGAASGVMLPADYSIIANQVRTEGSDVYSGRSVSDLRRDYVEIIRFLLQKGAKATIPPDFDSDNIPLLLAAKYRDLEIIKLLLDFKADPNSRDMFGKTALHVMGLAEAVPYQYKNAPEIANLMISQGARVLKSADGEGGPNGETPITLTKSQLNIIQSPEALYWRDVPFYNEIVNSLKSLIDIYSKL
jgi:hypothetical protein